MTEAEWMSYRKKYRDEPTKKGLAEGDQRGSK
jgi:hypothetical protein